MLHGLGDCTPERNCGCIGAGDGHRVALAGSEADTKSTTEWLDEATIAVTTRTRGGQMTTTWTWPDRESAIRNAPKVAALEPADLSMNPGERRTLRRILTRLGTFYLGHLSGPPRWHWPRAGIKRREGYREFMLGWLDHAFVIGWARCRTERQEGLR